MKPKIKIERKAVTLQRGGVKVNRVGMDESAPNFTSFFDARGMENPLPMVEIDGEMTVAKSNAAVEGENAAMLEAIIQAKREQRDRYRTATDPNYYIVLVFQNSAQREEFLEKTKWDDPRARFVDGLKLAARLGVDIQPINLPRTAPRATPKALRGHSFIE